MIKTERFIVVLLVLFLFVAGPLARGEGLYYTGYGGNQVVSGSLHLIALDGDTFILDAGSFLGDEGAKFSPITREVLEDVQGVIITHAHTDHIGRLLELIKKGYRGPIYMSRPTEVILPIMLTMAARYGDQGEEAYYYSRASYNRNTNTHKSTPVHTLPSCSWGKKIHFSNIETLTARRSELQSLNLYLCSYCIQEEVEEVMKHVESRPLREPFPVSSNVTASFYLTPHIPGSVMVFLEGQSGLSLLYTGDFGSGLSPFLPPQEEIYRANYALIEGTYGPWIGELPIDRRDFQREVGQRIEEGMRIIIPSFVLDRTQQVLFELQRGVSNGYIPPETPIFVLGSTAVRINNIYRYEFLKDFYEPYFTSLYATEGPFGPTFYQALPRLREIDPGEIIITSPGMADGGYAKELIAMYLEEEDTAILFTGYLSPETLGGRLLEATRRGEETIVIDGQNYIIRATVRQMRHFSGHGTPSQIEGFLAGIVDLEGILIVHSAFNVAKALKEYYQRAFPYLEIIIPEGGREYELLKPLEELGLCPYGIGLN